MVRAIAIVLLMAMAVPAFAACERQGTPAERAACYGDFKRLCPSLTDCSSTWAMVTCVVVNRARFSKACSAVLSGHGL